MTYLEGQPLIEPTVQHNDKPFAEMAALIRHNKEESFGGAFVVVPPEGGEPLATLLLDNRQDVAQFWSTLKTKCDIALAQIGEQERARQAGRW